MYVFAEDYIRQSKGLPIRRKRRSQVARASPLCVEGHRILGFRSAGRRLHVTSGAHAHRALDECQAGDVLRSTISPDCDERARFVEGERPRLDLFVIILPRR